MNFNILLKCIDAIQDESATGFSYVDRLMNVLMEYDNELHINNIVVVWHVSFPNDTDKEFVYHSKKPQFNYEYLRINELCNRDSYITSDDSDFSNYRRSNDLATSQIVVLPINYHSRDLGLLPTKGILIFFSNIGSKVDITNDQLELLHKLVNKREPKIFTSLNVVNAFKKISSKTHSDELSYLNCYKHIGESLDIISNKSTLHYPNSGLRHYSLWQYKFGVNNGFSLIKEFNRNTFDRTPHKITNTCLSDKSTHFLIDIIKKHKSQINKGMDTTILSCITYDEAKRSFKKNDSYFKDLGFCDKKSTIIVVASGKGSSCMISCLYIKNIAYSVFISSELIKHFIQEINRRIQEESDRTKNLLLKKLMTASFEYSKESAFYSKASFYLKKANEATDCLIYMLDEKGRPVLKSDGEPLISDLPHEETEKLEIPSRYVDDIPFSDWLEHIRFKTCFSNGYINYPNHRKGIVKSAMALQISVNNTISGLIILINKNHEPSSECVFYYNTFIIDNYLITRFCGRFLIQYQQLQNSIKNRNYLLSKLRHEIPTNTEAIRFSISNIRSLLEATEIKRNYIHVILNNILLNNSRTYLLANFFSTVDFKKEQFARDKSPVNLWRFLNSYIDIFRTEGDFRHVEVYFKIINENITINVSNYYLLAIVNVITNAIRYAAEGTRVYIEVFEDKLVVTDVGIPIWKNELDKIYNEGYRSDEAKAICEKGMGYGLYLSKMILESHHSCIEASCESFYEENLYLQYTLCAYLNRLAEEKRNRFIFDGLDDFNIPLAVNLYNHINNNYKNKELDMTFCNYQHQDFLQKWLDYLKRGNLVFLDMEDELKKEIYQVTFTIKYKH